MIIIFLIFLNKFKKINYLESKIYLSIVLIFLIIVHSLILSNINKNYEIQIDSLFRLVSYIIFAYLISIQFSKKEFLKFFQFFCIFFLIINSLQYIGLIFIYCLDSINLKQYYVSNADLYYNSIHIDDHEIKMRVNDYFNYNTKFTNHFYSFSPFVRNFIFTEINLFNFILLIFMFNFNKYTIILSTFFLAICRSFITMVYFYYQIIKKIKNIYLLLLIIILSLILIYFLRDIASILKPRIFLFYKYSFFLYDNFFIGVGLNNYMNNTLHDDVWKRIFIDLEQNSYYFNLFNNFLNNFESKYSSTFIYNFYDHEMLSTPYIINSPHNSILQIFVEYGIIFGIIILYIIFKIYKIESNKEVLVIFFYLLLNSFFPGNPETLILFIFLFLKTQVKSNI